MTTDPLEHRSRRDRRLSARRSARRLWWPTAALVGAFVVVPVAALDRAEQPVRPTAAPAQVIAPAAADQRTDGSRPVAAQPSRVAPLPAADERFIDALDANGVDYPSRDEAITAGHRVCTFLAQGGTPAGARRLAVPRGSWSENDAGAVVDAAARTYCGGGR